MKKHFSFLIFILILTSCGTSKNFNKRKYLKLKNKSVLVKVENTTNQNDEEIDYSSDTYKIVTEENDVFSTITPETIVFEEKKQSIEDSNNSLDYIGHPIEACKDFEPERIKYKEQGEKKEPKKEGEENILAFVSLIALCLTLIFPFFLPVSFILGIIALIDIKKESERYNNKWMALTAIWVSLFLMLLIISLITIFLLFI